MKRVAAPMVGGMITATVLTLVVIPAIYQLWRGAQVARRPGETANLERSEHLALASEP
jgi:Cu(I)/Ag(I) efflux system membrane protein CusA/SilA